MPISAPPSPRKPTAARLRPNPMSAVPVGIRSPTACLAVVSALVFALVGTGCGAPGLPEARHPVTPQTAIDLYRATAGRRGGFSLTLPSKSTDDDSSPRLPSVEIYSGILAPGAALPKKPELRLVNTIPGDLTKNYLAGGRFQFQVPFDPADVARAPGQQEIYDVRTRAFKGGPSWRPLVSLYFAVYPITEAIQRSARHGDGASHRSKLDAGGSYQHRSKFFERAGVSYLSY